MSMNLFNFFPGFEDVTSRWSLWQKVVYNLLVPFVLLTVSIGIGCLLAYLFDNCAGTPASINY